MSAATPAAAVRVVILGASNVARGIGTIVEVARSTLGSPVEIVAAMGHGRSYGLTTSIPLRTLPGILECGLWTALAERAPLPTYTILTDIGNDLFYGCSPEQVIEWTSACAARLRPLSEQLAITGLPLESVRGVGPLRFRAFRNLLFPKSTLALVDAQRYALEIDAAVREIAREQGAQFIAPRANWYGVDPIHLRMRGQRAAWLEIFSALRQKDFSSSSRAATAWREWWRVMTIRPQRSHVLRIARECAQPAVRLHDGSTVSFY